MNNNLLARSRAVLRVQSHTKGLVGVMIVGPSDEGGDYIVLKYMRGGRDGQRHLIRE